MPRIYRSAGSFAIVLAAYWTYKLVAVPWIEPPVELSHDGRLAVAGTQGGRGPVGERIKALQGLFPPGSWELKSPKILESKQIKLLVQDYRTLEDGRQVEICPLTMIFTPDAPTDDPSQPSRLPVILEAPEGALLEFDEPFQLHRMKIGRLVAGKLKGRIRIRSAGTLPGPEDDLEILTREVQISEEAIWTQHPVDFRYGPHYGRGRRMRIDLTSGEKGEQSGLRGPSIAGIRSFRLGDLQRLHLELDDPGLLRDGAPVEVASADAGQQAGSSRQADEPPPKLIIEVKCDGPFRFDLIDKVATFDRRVDARWVHPHGPSDQLSCERLSIFFTARAATQRDASRGSDDDSKKQDGTLFDLQPQRIEARGDPVVASAPSQRVEARGERLEYHFDTGRIVLDDAREVILTQFADEIHGHQSKEVRAQRLTYQPAGPGRLGQVAAEGPGWLRGYMDDYPDQELVARWTTLLQIRPFEENQVVSLSGGASLRFPGFGNLNAPEIHFYLRELPPQGVSKRLRVQPERMLACQPDQVLTYQAGRLVVPYGGRTEPRRHVLVNSSRLTAELEQLEVWFEQAPPRQNGSVPGAQETTPRGFLPAASSPQVGDMAADLSSPVQHLLPADQSAAPPLHRQEPLDLTGCLLQARVVLRDREQPELSELSVVDGTRYVEKQPPAGDGQRPADGTLPHVVDATEPYSAVAETGRWATLQGLVEGHQMLLSGPNINLRGSSNRMWIDGPGRMQLPLTKDLKGRPLSRPGTLEVQWKRLLEFDGRTARFEDSVTAAGPNLTLETEELEAQLTEAVRFDDSRSRQAPTVQRILCRGIVHVQSRTFDGSTQTSTNRMEVSNLEIDQRTGELKADGPGWLRSVRLESGGLMRGLIGTPSTAQSTSGSDGRSNTLRCLHVRFQGGVVGNVHENRRQMTFREQVRTTDAPVDAWEARLDVNHPDALPPDGVTMSCDSLLVNQAPVPGDRQPTMELEASGNVVIDGKHSAGSIYTARAARATYTGVKHLLVLEGDGRTDAELFRQQQVGGPAPGITARRILYWPKTMRVELDGVRSVEVSGFSNARTGTW